ncbi:unnamed protein product [Urochloa humidicola]
MLQELEGFGSQAEESRATEDPMLFEAALSQEELLSQAAGSNGRVDEVDVFSAQQKRSVEPTSATVEAFTCVDGLGNPNVGAQLCQEQESVLGSASVVEKEGLLNCEMSQGLEQVGPKVFSAGGMGTKQPDHSPLGPPDGMGTKENRKEVEAHEADARDGPVFDLNIGCDPMDEARWGHEENIAPPPTLNGDLDRSALKQADARLNKEVSGARPLARGVSCFSIPLRKSLLCAPPPRTKQSIVKKSQQHESGATGHKERGKATLNSTVRSNLSADDEAATILLKASGVLGEDEPLTDMARQKFGESLVCPLQADVVGEMRSALGLAGAGGADRLAPLVQEADDSNDA